LYWSLRKEAVSYQPSAFANHIAVFELIADGSGLTAGG
jgi:hypothetical protein